MLRRLWPYLGKMKFPVIAYMLVILSMGWQALNRWTAAGQRGSGLALVGALLFIASDSILAVNKFRGRLPGAHFYILSTYFTAQWLIAVST